jgi:hypothetical protein
MKMTTTEAITELKALLAVARMEDFTATRQDTALRFAIRALSKLNALQIQPRVKLYHSAKLFGSNGEVSPLCAKKPKALALPKALWTIDDAAVTCPKCKAAIGRLGR